MEDYLLNLCREGKEALLLPPRLRPLLSQRMPSSELVADSRILASKYKHDKLIAVGDYVTRILIELNVKPWAVVVDCTIGKKPINCPSINGFAVVSTRNERSTINCRAALEVCSAVRKGSIYVRVEGEEDLLALPAILCSDIGSVVVYGLPGKGMIVSRVTNYAKRLVLHTLGEFEY